MKQLINNHVHGNQLATVSNNSFSVEPKSVSVYGLLPKFEIDPLYSVVIEYQPRGGIRGLINSLCASLFSIFYPDRMLTVCNSYSGEILWCSLYKWIHTLGWYINACRIRNERVDNLTVSHCTNVGGNVHCYNYDVTISAKITPKDFYNYLKSQENSSVLQMVIENCVKDVVSSEIKMQAGNPAFVLHTQITSPILEQAGYQVTDCRIQYNQNV